MDTVHHRVDSLSEITWSEITLIHPSNDSPPYSSIRRVLLTLDYQAYSAALARFLGMEPLSGEILAMDGKVLRGSYQEDASHICKHQLPHIFAVARNFALNLYWSNDFDKMTQAERQCQYGLDTLKRVFRIK